eukprot:g33121.t1
MYPSSLLALSGGNPFSAPRFQLLTEPAFPHPHAASKASLPSERVAPRRRLAAAAVKEQEQYSCEYGSARFYALCGLGGILSCGTTHTAVVPLDLVKCRIQVDPGKYQSIFKGFSVTLKEDGVRGLGKGWAPTFIGYSMQGLCKFGFYEVFKNIYGDILGE